MPRGVRELQQRVLDLLTQLAPIPLSMEDLLDELGRRDTLRVAIKELVQESRVLVRSSPESPNKRLYWVPERDESPNDDERGTS